MRPNQESTLWTFVFSLVLIFVGMFGFIIFGRFENFFPLSAMGIVTIWAALAQLAWLSLEEKKIKSKAGELAKLEEGPATSETDTDFIHRQLNRAIAREELTLLHSQRRSGALFRMGVGFLGLSILCPIGATLMYLFLEPIPATSLTQLKELRGIIDAPKGISTFSRDWHILVGGIAFGFLFLAAAGGLLKERAKELASLTRASVNVGYFERLKIIVDLKLRQFSAGQSVLVSYVVERLEDTPLAICEEAKPSSQDDDAGSKLIADIVRSLRGTS